MNDKKDREVRKLFSVANSTAMDMLNDDELSQLTPHEIFIASCKMALESPQDLPTSYSPVAEVNKNNVAFVLDNMEAVLIAGDEEFINDIENSSFGEDDE